MPDDSGRADLGEPSDGARLREVAAEIAREFPSVSRRTALVLFEVDPQHVQAQWQLVADDLEEAKDAFPERASGVRPQVRLVRLGARPDEPAAAGHPPEKASGDDSGGTAVFRVPEQGLEYFAELGLTSAEGGWLLLARSNRVRPPRPVGGPGPSASAAAADGTTTAHADGSASDGARASAGRRAQQMSAPEPFRSSAEEPPGGFDPTLWDSGVRLPPVFPHPARRYGWSPTSPFLRVVTALEHSGQGFPSVPLPVCRSGKELPSEELAVAAPMGGGPGPEAPAQAREPLSGPAAGAQAERLPVFPRYDPSGALSSRAIADRGGRARFELRAELLVYGEAEPGSVVRLFGQDLRVGPGGRFYLRRRLDSPELEEMALGGYLPLASEGLESE